jgi:ABC-type dipeptide/oligopeptide/nickel transport system permease subunit
MATTATAIAAGAEPRRRTLSGPQALLAFARDYRLAAAGGLIVLAFVLIGLLADMLAPYDPNQISIRDALAAPSMAHLLGTDNQGRDLLSRLIVGARMSLLISMASVSIGGGIGVLLGILAAYYPRTDMLIMRLMDALLAFPGIIIALTIISILGQGINNLIVAIAIYQVPQFARLAHGLALTIKQQSFVEAANAVGAPDHTILLRHIVPNLLPPVIVQTTLLVPGAILTASTLSFLGLGVPPPTAEWGGMLQNGLQWAGLSLHVMLAPGLTLMLAVLGFNLLGDGLRDALDPSLRRI